MTLDRLTQITSVGITSGITLNNVTLTGVTTIASLDSVSVGGTITAVDGNFSGNVSIAGTLTYEDVTNIDSVGLVTARSGIHVTGGSVGIGTDNPARKVEIFDTAATVLQLNSTNSGGTSLRIQNSGTDKMYMGLAGDFIIGQGSNVTDSAIRANGSLLFASGGGTERLRITSGGNVGIGTDNPTAKLTVAVSDGEAFRLQNLDSSISGGESLHFALEYPNALGSSTGWRHLSRYAGSQYQIASNIDNAGYNVKLSITEQGRVSIGTEFSPGATLHIRDSNDTTQGAAQIKITKGVGSGAAPSSVSRENCYIHLGGSEWGAGANGNYLMGFGYTNGETGTGIPAYIGFKEVTTSGYTYGDLIFGTRDNTTGTNNATERLRIDSSGRVTKPYQLWIAGSPTNTGGSGIFNSFNTSLFADPVGLSFSSDRITVPIAGVYMITFNTICDTTSSRKDSGIIVNGSTISSQLSEDSTAGYHYRSASLAVKLAANDYIQFSNDDWYDSTAASTTWRTASVYLLG